jgi:hypothetical protein
MKKHSIFYLLLSLVTLYSLILSPNKVYSQESNSNAQVFKRVISAQIYYNSQWILNGDTIDKITTIFDTLQPTYISGLIYLNESKKIETIHIQAFQAIRKILPNTKLDITLNPNQYKKAEDLVAKMKSINAQIKPDIWYLDFSADAYKVSPKHLSEAIEYAHSQGQMIGGNEIDKILLKEADFVAVHDGQEIDLKLKDEIKEMSENNTLTILFQINNDSNRSNDDTVHTFIKKWKTYERIEHIKRLARNQNSWKYRLMYPVFFPVYLHRDAYKANEDGDALKIFKELMINYN